MPDPWRLLRCPASGRTDHVTHAELMRFMRTGWFTQHELGKRMVYCDDVAGRAVSQFLQPKDPHIGMRCRFAAAADVPLEERVMGPKAEKRKK